ncbi:Ig-like domain-containing protein [uncultured Sunxiuqinia sp.]|uniref:Ig-like domain-containing protein n=1 Tax=uncultured Sunxiuqinia sp. TaxID=1573825 RepID=UPI002AA88416|nr:Ig-like domain-containing protein [uncultured Sunxiuqinia sp.]
MICTTVGNLVITQSPAAGTTVTTGVNVVTITVTDQAGNETSCDVNFTVVDNTDPVITSCATAESADADGSCEALVPDFTGDVTASDNCTTVGNLVITQSPAAGTTVTTGVNVVTIAVTDQAGNETSCDVNFTVIDNTDPVITSCATAESADADGSCEALVPDFTGDVTASDNCTTVGNLVITQSPAAGTTVTTGVNVVTITVTDQAGNETSCDVNFTVVDNTDPVITSCATAESADADGSCEALVPDFTGDVTASDNCTTVGNLVITQSPAAGTTVTTGVNVVTITVTDQASNETSCDVNFTVVDNTDPVITSCATAESADADGSCEALVPDFTGDVTASDNCTTVGNLVITQSPAAGTTVTTGVNVVTITVTDQAGNETSCDVNFTVSDVNPPTFTCNDVTVELDESDQYAITDEDITLIVTDLEDNCSGIDGEISISLDTEVFTCATLGAQTVTVTVSDEAGNIATCDVTITVVDTIPPTITCSGDVTATIQSNGTCTGIVSVPSPTVSDNCGVVSVINDFNSSSNASGNYPAGETVVTWMVTDNSGNTETCTQTINVIAEPQAINDSRSTPEDTPITIAVLANDLDCDDNLVNSSLEITSDPTNGVVVVNSNGTVTYTPNTNYNGSDQFTYQICDAYGQCDEATVTINVTPVNDPPVAVDDLNNTFVNQETTGKVLTNDYDIDGNSLSTTLQSGPSNGTLVFNTDGTYSYTPNAGYLGEDVFTYLLSDGQGGTDMASVYITVISDHSTANQPPVANEDAYVTKENVKVTGNMLENDYDPDGNPLVFNTELVVQPPVGTVQVFVDGSFEYIPKDGFSGQVNFTYQVCDDLTPAMCNTADVIIIVDPNANDNITVAVDDAFFTKINSKLIRDVSSNDYDPEDDNTTYSLMDASLHGTVTLNAGGFFTYTPNTDYIGPDQFTYQVCDDGDPSACDHATVYINVSEVNHAPNAVDDWFNREDKAANVLANDSDPDGDELVLNTTPVVDVTNGSLVINSDGTYIYTPDEFYFGLDSFTYEVCDNALVPLCDQATVVIFLDTDKDGAADVVDIDDDNDGILDVDEGDQTVDSDNDGIPDSLDIDSDNDGITDNQESQDEKNYVAPVGTDSDGDGWDDAYDDDSGGTPIIIVDSDDDGLADFVDTDSDNDGIDDSTEGHDANHDGVADAVPVGTDSDGDGLDDAYDTVAIGEDPVANVTGSNAPTDNSDGDQVSDYRDTDSDNDGLTDQEEATQNNDPDNDGLANYLDIDSDGDGITDNQESQPEGAYVPPIGEDTDGDGIDDAYDPDNGGTPIASIDSDGDGDPDYLDEDSDNDSVPDSIEAHDANGDGVADTAPSGQDSDGDGLDDAYDTTNDFNDPLNVIGTNTPSPNSDNDVLSDWRDIDDDNDGILTSDEVNNSSDNDNDGVIDYLDIDSDNDGIVDNFEGQDNLTNLVSSAGIDSDGDGLDDAYDPDTGGTPIGFTDTDGDGIKDYLDEDSDNDHVPDYIEAQDTDKNGQPDIAYTDSDSDGDGLDDSNDNVAGTGSADNSAGTNVPLQDSDGDGTPDWRDTDDDNDGIETSLNEDDNGDGDPTNDDCNYNGIPNYLDEESCDLLIPNGFSPNGDGINDYFRVRGIYQYPNANIEIYNRWGTKVFEKENFGNIPIYGDPDAWWDGRANVGGSSNSEILPSGTYFLVLILDGSTIHKGIVYINR